MPVYKDGRGSIYAATIELTLIEEWWTKWPFASIAIPTGMRFSVLDLDVKPGKDGRKFIPNFFELSNVIVKTQGGGIHLYFRSEGSPHNTSDHLALGVDTRGENGYVLVPPSKGYEFIKGNLIDNWGDLPYWPQEYRIEEKKKSNGSEEYEKPSPLWVYLTVSFIDNDDIGWEDWNRIGMALWASTDGHEWGRKAFHKYSKKSDKYDAVETENRWEHWNRYRGRSEPSQIGYGTLVYLANATDPDWQRKAMDILYEDQRYYDQRPVNFAEEARLLGISWEEK